MPTLRNPVYFNTNSLVFYNTVVDALSYTVSMRKIERSL